MIINRRLFEKGVLNLVGSLVLSWEIIIKIHEFEASAVDIIDFLFIDISFSFQVWRLISLL